jgi:hypothetical protein
LTETKIIAVLEQGDVRVDRVGLITPVADMDRINSG